MSRFWWGDFSLERFYWADFDGEILYRRDFDGEISGLCYNLLLAFLILILL